MKKHIIFLVLIIGIIFASISAINASENDVALNYSNSDILATENVSNVYSVNNEKTVNINGDDLGNDELESTALIAPDIKKYYKNDTNFEATLLDSNGKPISNQTIVLDINGKQYTRITNNEGTASMAINLNIGEYLIDISYKGNDLYASSKTKATIVVLPTIESANLTKYFKNSSQYYATFLDGDGSPLVGADVTFNINGVFYPKTTDKDGVAKLNINLAQGTYIITAIQLNNGFQHSNIVKVLPTIKANNLTKAYKDNHQYYATFLDGDGSPLVGADVTFNINGVFYPKTTDKDGVAKLNINLNAGRYILTAYSNDGCAISNIITVLKNVKTFINAENTTFFENETNTISVTLYDELGYTIPNMGLTLSINGTNLYEKTNDNGIAKFDLTLPAGLYAAYYQFDGSEAYAPTGTPVTITVNKGVDVNIDVLDDIVYQGDKFNILVKDLNNKPLSNINVVFTINGIKYDKTTNSKGIANLTINLNPNTYTIYYNINQSGYNPMVKSSDIIVVSTNKTTISSTTTSVYYNASQTFDVLLSVDGIPLPNQLVHIKINGVTYNRTTDSKGMAYLTINLSPNVYTVECSYDGNSKLNPTNSKFTLKVLNLTVTTITYIGEYDYIAGTGKDFQVSLTDKDGNILSNQQVIFIVNGKEYPKTTNSEGVASVNINLPVGIYEVQYKFNGSTVYGKSQGVTTIRVMSQIANGNGYWLFGRDMYKADLNSLSKQGVGNIFLNFAAFSTHGEKNVLDWIKKANSYGIRVHIWMQTFYDGKFISPLLADGTPNYELFDKLIDEAKYYAGLEGVSGVHLDYLRFPGTAYKYPQGTAAINKFVQMVSEEVNKVNPNIILSAAVMPETTNNKYFYGQDIAVLGKYLDVIIPMVYKGNYKAGSSWITSTTKWFVDNSQGAQIWVGLQAYKSDDNVVPLSVSELTIDAQAAINGGAKGVVMFRWGVTNFIDFNKLDYPTDPTAPTGSIVKVADIQAAASYLKNFMEKEGVLPDSIKVGKLDCSMAQFLYLMADYLANYNKKSEFEIIKIAEPSNPTGDEMRKKLNKDEYLTLASSIVKFMKENNAAPDYMASSLGNIKYSTLLYNYAKIVAYAGNNKQLPAFVYVTNIIDDYSLTVVMMPSVSSSYKYIFYKTTWLSYCPKCGYHGTLLDNPKKVYEGEITCSYCDADYCGVTGKEKISSSKIYLTRLTDPVPVTPVPIGANISLADIKNASLFVKGYYEANQEIPESVEVGEGIFTTAQYLYLISKAIVNIESSNNETIKLLEVQEPQQPTGSIISSTLDEKQYTDLASRVATFIETNGQAPNYASSDLGKIIYHELIDAFSRIVAYYTKNGVMPKTVAIQYSGGSSQSITDLANSLVKGLTSEYDKAQALYNYVRDYISYSFYYNTQKGAEGTLTSGSGNCCDQAQLLVAMARAVGLTARFATGYCTFTSGSTYGHVWVQFDIGGKWIVADPTSTRNSFGVIKNWNTNSYTNRGTFDVLPY